MNVYKKITMLIVAVIVTWQLKAQIPTGSKLWLRADTLVTLSSGLVSNWGDCSGNANNASQSDTTLRPSRVLNYQNSKPAILFNGTDIMSTTSIDFSATQQMDVFIVMKDNQTANPNIILELSDNYNAVASGAMFINNYNGYNHMAATYDIINNSAIGVNKSTTNFVILNDVLDRSLSVNENVVLVNSVQPSSSTYVFNGDVSGNFGNHPIYIGGRGSGTQNLTDGYYLEIIVYPTKLSGTQRNQVVNYLKNKYNLTLDAPDAFHGGLADGHAYDSSGLNTMFPMAFNEYIYTGGINDGSAQDSASTNVPFALSNNQYIFAGGVNDGSAQDSAASNIPFSLAYNQYIFAGGVNDGSAQDTAITNVPFSMSKNMYAFAGGIDDGSAHDSLINQNFDKSINMYAFGGGKGDGWAKRFSGAAGIQSSITCTGGTAVISVSASGGIEPYFGTGTYTVTAGTYTYIVNDAAGAYDTLIVKAGPPNMIVPKITATPILCKGGISTIAVSAIGGTPPLSGLGTYYDTAGYHKYIITDANGCKDSIDITITEPANALSVSITQDSIICPGSYTTIQVTAAGGTAPYTGTGTFNAISNVYTYTVTDAAGCIKAATISVVGSSANLQISMSNSPLYRYDSVQLASNLVGVTYEWLDPTGSTVSTAPTYSRYNLTQTADSGVYKLKLLDSDGCRLVDTIRLDVRGVYVTAKAFLNGPYVSASGKMHDSIRAKGLLPLTEPYSTGNGMQSQFFHVNGGGGETTTPARLAITGDSAVVDWVFLEFRDPINPATIKATKSALLLRNGTIVDENGKTELLFKELVPGDYAVSIKHRNHFGMQSASTLAFPDSSTLIDWTSAAITPFVAPLNTNLAYKLVGSVRTLWNGDVNKDRRIRYNGVQNDRLTLLQSFGSNTNATLTGYRKDDVNMDGKAKYNGVQNDRLSLLQNMGSNPNSTLNEQTSN